MFILSNSYYSNVYFSSRTQRMIEVFVFTFIYLYLFIYYVISFLFDFCCIITFPCINHYFLFWIKIVTENFLSDIYIDIFEDLRIPVLIGRRSAWANSSITNRRTWFISVLEQAFTKDQVVSKAGRLFHFLQRERNYF